MCTPCTTSIWIILKVQTTCPVHVFNSNMFTVFRYESISDKWTDTCTAHWLTNTASSSNSHFSLSLSPSCQTWNYRNKCVQVTKCFPKTKIIVILNIRIWFTARSPFHQPKPPRTTNSTEVWLFQGFHHHTHTFGLFTCKSNQCTFPIFDNKCWLSHEQKKLTTNFSISLWPRYSIEFLKLNSLFSGLI